MVEHGLVVDPTTMAKICHVSSSRLIQLRQCLALVCLGKINIRLEHLLFLLTRFVNFLA